MGGLSSPKMQFAKVPELTVNAWITSPQPLHMRASGFKSFGVRVIRLRVQI